MRHASVLLLVVLASSVVGGAFARPPSADAPAVPTTGPFSRTLLREQLPDGPIAVPSHDVTNHTDVSEGADDVYLGAGVAVTTVEWWGIYGVYAPPETETFVIRFYSDSTSVRYPSPGTLRYEQVCTSVARDSVGDCSYWSHCYHYEVQLDPPFLALESERHWISIQALYDAPPLWYWLSCDAWEAGGADAVWRSDAEPDWRRAMEYSGEWFDFAFRLSGEQWSIVPDDPIETSWGRVKGLFR